VPTPPTTSPSAEPGTRDLLFNDDMTDSSSGWQELNENFATITYDSGVLAFRYNKAQSWAYTIRNLDAPETTLLPAANFAPQSDGIFGLLCGDSASGKLYGAVADTQRRRHLPRDRQRRSNRPRAPRQARPRRHDRRDQPDGRRMPR